MTIPKECKRLAEVDFPIAAVSKHAVREKSIRHGHPSTLHLWWARRPLASSRAMLMALLLPDPADPDCPQEFRDEARRLLLEHHGRPVGWRELAADDLGLRKTLLQFIADFANWDNAANAEYLKTARGLVKAAHGDETPLVVDPFAGGGSIPLEALRLGCDAFASDLNPVAVLINKVMLEDIPRYANAKIPVKKNDGTEVIADGLAEALRIAGGEVKAAAEKELAEFYPPDPDGARPIAYLWARTVRCESPNCGAEIPLVRSFWLAKKANRRRALRYKVVRSGAPTVGTSVPLTIPLQVGSPPHLEFEIFEPASLTDKAVPGGTVSRARATCPCCNTVLPPERVRAQLSAQRGGADVIFDGNGLRTGGAFLLAVVTLKTGQTGRNYRLATERDYATVWKAQQRIAVVNATPLPNGLRLVPDEPLPPIGTLGFRVQRYGMSDWGDLYTSRQKLELVAFSLAISGCGFTGTALADSLLMAYGRCTDHWSSNAMWIQDLEAVAHTFGRQALPLVWDFVEAVGTSTGGANWLGQIDWVERVIASTSTAVASTATVEICDAAAHPLPDASSQVFFTDPPYYDAIPYADLSDYFFVWHKRVNIGDRVTRSLMTSETGLTPKYEEAVQDDSRIVNGRRKDRDFFEHKIGDAFADGRRILRPDGIASVVFAHKTTEGWEALLSALISANLTITGSWPISTEREVRLRSIASAALTTSVHLVCRPRDPDAPIGDWSRVFSALPGRVRDWIERLEGEGIRGADLVFACIGPALELYSQNNQVLDAQDRPIPLGGDPTASEPHKRGYLAYVWETVARIALEQVLSATDANARNGSTAGALEEDARLTALFLWTMRTTEDDAPMPEPADAGDEDDSTVDDDEDVAPAKKKKAGMSLPFDVVRRIAQPLGIHLPTWKDRIIETEKGIVYLKPVTERARSLFGEEGADAVAGALESSPLNARNLQLTLFGEGELLEPAPVVRGPRRGRNVADEQLQSKPMATTLDNVHAAMLLQRAGRTQALRAMLVVEQEKGTTFLRLANALSGLYPRQSEEKRLVDAMLLAYPK